MAAKDYYAVLGVDRDATDEEIKAIYREMVKVCHPDVAGGDPEATTRFQEITEAYKVLIDPYRRKMHDNELPMKSYPLRRPTPEKVWKEVNDVILLRADRIGPFQRAIMAAKPLMLEEDKIILGFAGENSRAGAYLDVAADNRSLLNALEFILGKPMGYRYIEGDSADDWERIKGAEARAAERARSSAPIFNAITNTGAWDELMSRFSKTYSELQNRQYPQTKAAFLLQGIRWIKETRDETGYAAPEDVNARALARAIERLATLVDTSPMLVAIELLRSGNI